MNWYKKIIKFAAVRYMYHGTSINNLESILSEGLNTSHGSVYDETFQNERGERPIESYGGIYFTDNLRTALMAGFTAAEKNKIETQKSVLVIAQLEDKTPSILIDEDLLANPYWAVYEAAGNIDDPVVLEEWIINNFPNIEQGVNRFLKSLSSRRTQITDERFLENLRPYIPELLKNYAIQQLTIALNKEDWGTSTLKYNYPELEKLPDMGITIQNYRNSVSLFIQKANRLTEFMKDTFENNMRATEPISYRGKNKILLVSTINREDRDSDYYNVIDIQYLSDQNVLRQYINDIKEKYSDNFLMRYNENIIYDKKKFHELV